MDIQENLFEIKSKAFLHDPPEKAFVLGMNHEKVAKEYIKVFFQSDQPQTLSDIESYDH